MSVLNKENIYLLTYFEFEHFPIWRITTWGLPAFLENFAEDRSAVTVLVHDGTVPSSMSELMLALADGDACTAGDRLGRAGVLRDQLELATGQRVNGRGEEQVGLCAERVGGHPLTCVSQVPATYHQRLSFISKRRSMNGAMCGSYKLPLTNVLFATSIRAAKDQAPTCINMY